MPNHLGVAKLKAGYGIRFERSSYQKAKKTLLPDAPSSDEELLHDSDKKFFLLGLPNSFDRCAVRKILREIGWGVGNIQSSGWKTWAVYTNSDPPVRDFVMAGTHVVISDGGSSTGRGVFAAAAVRGWKSLASLSNEKVRNAPSNFVTPASCPTPAPASPGVFETYKTETDGKLQALEMKVDSMTQDIRKRDAVQKTRRSMTSVLKLPQLSRNSRTCPKLSEAKSPRCSTNSGLKIKKPLSPWNVDSQPSLRNFGSCFNLPQSIVRLVMPSPERPAGNQHSLIGGNQDCVLQPYSTPREGRGHLLQRS